MKPYSYIQRIVGILIFTVFIFNFLHSELGFLSHEAETHCVDFCKIVNESGNPAPDKGAINFYPDKTYFIIGEDIHRVQKETAFLTDDNTLKYLQKTNKVYLHNNTFLI